jgi:RHS repeat-associated protein
MWLGNVERKTSGTMNSDARRLGDDLDYQLDYEYEEGYAHRVKRIGGRYYGYDLNGNVVVEQDGVLETAGGGSGAVDVKDLGNNTYVADEGWGLNAPEDGSREAGTYRRDYQWNERDQLRTSTDSWYRVEYAYGTDGERSGKFSTSMAGGNNVETLYYNRMWSWRYDGLLSDRYGRNSKHIYVGGTRIATKVSRADGSFTSEEKVKQYYYHSDHLGSAQVISNWKGEEYERIDYTPYGELWIEKVSSADDIDIPYRFTGKERDVETGLYYYGARYLDSKSGRWLSADPALGEYIPEAPVDEGAVKRNGNLPGMGGIYNVINSHLYHYAGNNPLKYTDPDGRDIKVSENSSPRFKADFTAAINYLSKSESASRIIAYVSDAMDITVVEVFGISSTSGTIITWSPREGISPLSGGVISPSRILFHEIVHKFLDTEAGKGHFNNWLNDLMKIYPEGFPSFFSDDLEEEYVTQMESAAGKELGEKALRIIYNDVMRSNSGNIITTSVPDPTYHQDPPGSKD